MYIQKAQMIKRFSGAIRQSNIEVIDVTSILLGLPRPSKEPYSISAVTGFFGKDAKNSITLPRTDPYNL